MIYGKCEVCFQVRESWDRSSDRGQAHTRFEGGTHENCTERNETSYGMRERERKGEISRSSMKMMVLKRERERPEAVGTCTY